MTTLTPSPLRLSALSLAALVLAERAGLRSRLARHLRSSTPGPTFDFGDLRFSSTEVLAQLTERSDAC